ncbi:MAG: glycosyltransferase family 2 protein [Ilumatobacteraceae bacterium]
MTSVDVSVVIPTIGRTDLLGDCLRSLLACSPPADDIVVVDQSGAVAVRDLVDAIGAHQVRRVEGAGRGIARAMNQGLGAARHETVMVTHDDCTVAPDWVTVGARLATAWPGAIATGRVLPPAGSTYVPSTKSDPSPRDYTGTLTAGALYPACMVGSRSALLAFGGFDERPTLRSAAEDNDLCYRWLSSGRVLRYEPDLVVWHHDWRTPEELVRTHAVYAKAQGAMYAKHLYGGDRRVLRLLAWDLRQGLRSVIGGGRRVPRWQDPYREMVTSLLVGLRRGWREERRLDPRHRRLGSLFGPSTRSSSAPLRSTDDTPAA